VCPTERALHALCLWPMAPRRGGIVDWRWRLKDLVQCFSDELRLFPGRDPGKPIEPTVLNAACRSAVAATGLSKRVSAAFLRHASSGEWHGYLHHSGSARSRPSVEHGPLYAGFQQDHLLYDEPARPIAPGGDAAGLIVGCALPSKSPDILRRHGASYRRENAGHLGRRTSRHGSDRSLPDAAARRSRRCLRRLWLNPCLL